MALGLGGLVQKATSIRSIVKKGLQAWYKSDTTQAPLGEEEIANGKFILGPELLTNGSFSSDSNWTKGTNWSISNGNATVTNSATSSIYQNILDATKSYEVTFEITSITSGGLRIGIGTNFSDYFTQPGIYTYYGSPAVDLLARINPSSGTNASIDNVSIKQTNHNNSWSTAVSSGATVSVKNGSVDIVTDGAAAELKQTGVFTVGKKYQVTVDATINSGAGVKVGTDGTGNDDLIINNISSTGVYTAEFTATHADFEIAREGSSASSSTINSVSIREVTNSVKDYSSNINNGVLYSGTCLDFDGTDDSIDLDYWKSEAISASTKATFTCWINSDDATSEKIFLASQTGTNNRFYVATRSEKLDLGWGSSPWDNTPTNGTIPTLLDATWYRVVIVVDGLTCKVYLDGEYQYEKTNASGFTLDSNGLYLAIHGDGGNYDWSGKLADFQIYDSVWSASDVTYDYNNPDKDVFDNSDTSILSSNCKALYRLNEGAGNRVYNAAPVLGSELIVGGVSSTGSWGLAYSDTTLSVVDGVLRVSPSSTNDYGARQALTTVVGAIYKITATVNMDNASGGSGNLKISTSSNLGGGTTLTSSSGSIEDFYTATNTTTYIGVADGYSSGAYMEISAISVKQIYLSESLIYIGNPTWATSQPYIPQYAMSSYSKKMVFGGLGSGDQVDLGSEVTLAADKAASISFWFTYGTTDTSTDKYILGKISSATDYLIINPQSGGVDKIQIRMNNVSSQLDIDTDLTLGKIYHCVLTMPAYSSGSEAMKLYINGVLQSVTVNRTNNSWDFQRIGGHSGTSNNFDGILDEIAYFTKELSQAEVQEIFNSGLALDVRDHSCYYGSELVSNNDFTDNTLNTSGTSTTTWTRYKSGTSSASISDGVATLSIDGSNSNVVIHQADVFESGKIYKISLVAKASADFSITFRESQGATANNTPSTAVIATVPLTTEYQTFEYTFTATGNQGDIFIGRNSGDAAGANQTVTVDSISIKEIQTTGYWRNSGTDTWTNLSPYGNNGTVSGSPTTAKFQEVPLFKKDTFGLPMNRVRQKGLNLDGDSYVKVDDDSSLGAMDDGFTCAFWYRHFENIDTSNYSYLVTKGTGLGANVDHGFGASVYNNKIYADLNTADGRFNVIHTIGAASASSPVWYYITATYNGSNELELYVDATSRGTASVTGSVSATAEAYPITIGTDKNYYSEEARAVVDEVKWYNRALTQSEITKNFKASKGSHSSTSNWSDDFGDGFV